MIVEFGIGVFAVGVLRVLLGVQRIRREGGARGQERGGGAPALAVHRAPAKRTASDVVDEILEFFGDGELHELKEVADAVKLPEDKVEKVLDFLVQFGFVKRGVRITDSGRNFLTLPVEKRKRRHTC